MLEVGNLKMKAENDRRPLLLKSIVFELWDIIISQLDRFSEAYNPSRVFF